MSADHTSATPATPDRSEVLSGVIGVVALQMGMDPVKIGESDALEEDLGCDSLDIVEISMELEEHFGISVPDEFGDQVKTIGNITDGVLRLLAAHASH